jgi:hypothetical protein
MKKKQQTADEVKELLSPEALIYYHDHPVDFIEDWFMAPARVLKPGVCISSQQKKFLNAVAKNNFVSVESAHGTGKSTSYAFLTYWFLFTRDNPVDITKIRLCANSYNQLFDILWPELRRWIAFSPLKQLVTVEARSIYIPKFGKDGTINKEHTFVTPVSPSNPDNLQGAHAAHLMWLIDEAFGIQENLVWETIEGSTTEEDNKLIMAGQHTTLSGYVHESFHKNKAQWFNLRLNALESPFVTKDYIERLRKKYGEESDIYRIRVLGMEPSGRSDAFISYDKVHNAVERDIEIKGPVEFGLDIARFGDDMTVLTMRHGLKIYPQRTMSKFDSFGVVSEVLKAVKDMRRITKYQGTIKIKVDATGGHGSGVIDILGKDRDHNIEIIPIVYSSGGGDDVYANITSKMWGEIRDNIDGISLPNDEFLIEELIARTYKYDNNKIRIQDKASYKSLHDGISPDRSDSLCLCMTGIRAINRVFNNYVSTNRACHGELDIPWQDLLPSKFQVFIGLKMIANTVYGSFFLYNFLDDRLFQYDEFVREAATPEAILLDIKERANVPMQSGTSVCVNDIFSDSEAFSGGKDMSYKLLKGGVRVKEASQYDRQGAIIHLNTLLSIGKVKIEEKCVKTDKQFSEWSLHSNGSPERGFCLCENLLMITSIIRQRKEQRKKEQPKAGYTKEKRDFSKVLGSSSQIKSGKSGWEYLAT